MLTYAGVGYRYDATHLREGLPPTALAEVDLDVPSGAFLLLLGENGSGKSTLVRMANGLIPHFHAGEFRGTVRVAGDDTRECTVRELSRTVGVVFQNHEAQLFNGTVARELAFGPANLHLSREEITRRIHWAAEQTGITHLLPRETHQLSGGERARVAIASVLTMRPALLVLDEPTAALDPVATASLWGVVADLRQQGATVIVTEHRPEAVWAHASAVAALHAGRRIFHGSPHEALRNPIVREGLPIPTVTRLFTNAGLPERPTSIAEAAAMLRERDMTLQAISLRHPTPGERLLVARGMTYTRQGRAVLRDISLDLRRGETVALVGPNGAGKTTLLRLLAGLARPDRGEITGDNGQSLPGNRVGLLLQNANDALFCTTVREEVAYSAHALRRYDADWIASLVARFMLEPLLDRPPLALSDGEKRRVALAAMLAHRPDLVLLDEPTAGQDQERRDALATLLGDLRAAGVAVLLATHDLAFAARHCTRWLVIADGALLADTTPERVLNNPALLARAHLLPTPIAALAMALNVPYPGENATVAPASDRVTR